MSINNNVVVGEAELRTEQDEQQEADQDRRGGRGGRGGRTRKIRVRRRRGVRCSSGTGGSTRSWSFP